VGCGVATCFPLQIIQEMFVSLSFIVILRFVFDFLNILCICICRRQWDIRHHFDFEREAGYQFDK